MARHVRFTEENELTLKQERLITALLAYPTIMDASRVAGVAERTARRWLKLPHVQEAYRAAQQTLFDEALNGLKAGVGEAIETLRRNMTDSEVPPSTQVRAAQIWLEQAVALHKMNVLEQKIAELEAIINERYS